VSMAACPARRLDIIVRRCPHCKKFVDASEQVHLWRSSDILIVHLKRFGVDRWNMRSRLNTFVDVPLGEVDFTPYFAPNSPFRDQNNRYRLYAVSNHVGRLAFFVFHFDDVYIYAHIIMTPS
jgi:ubiquitin C-terminal hydrolase